MLWAPLQAGTPDLSGVWNATWSSNDPINEALLAAYRDAGSTRTPLENIAPKAYVGKLRINVTPVEITVRLFNAPVTEANTSTVARLYREENGDVVLTYQSTPRVPSPSARDSNSYNFAARLIFHPENGGELRGGYHTDRRKELGQNTAGEMKLVRG